MFSGVGRGKFLSISLKTLFGSRQGYPVSLLKIASILKQKCVKATSSLAWHQGATSWRQVHTNSVTAFTPMLTCVITQSFLHLLSSVPERFINRGRELKGCLEPAQSCSQPNYIRMALMVLSSVKPEPICALPMGLALKPKQPVLSTDCVVWEWIIQH